MQKKDKKENKKKKDEEDLSQDWFEDHEPYDEEKKLSKEEVKRLEENLEEDREFKSRVSHFLANQKKDVSLEKMFEISEDKLEEVLPKKSEDFEKKDEDAFDYMTGNKIEGMKYDSFEPETKFSRPGMSSAEMILEEQKALYTHLKSVGGEMVGNNKNDLNPVTPRETQKKNYFQGKKFTTGPY
ncbi:MAG: hypothetical protein NUV46_03470 [Nanoarchaeota archaeon]|nr:hypothetical protein [Nanoarchaeota archaeon]